MIEEDPFDTSAIIIPSATAVAPSTATSGLTTGNTQMPIANVQKATRLPQMLSQLEPFISPKEKVSENNDDFR